MTVVATCSPKGGAGRSLEGLTKNARQRADGRYYWHWNPNWLTVFPGILSYRERLEACARSIETPYFWYAMLCPRWSDQGVREFLQQCPHAEYRVIDRAAHMVAGDKSDMFTAAILGFLKKSRPTMGDFGGEARVGSGNAVDPLLIPLRHPQPREGTGSPPVGPSGDRSWVGWI